jgi:glutamate dehydrogenase (NAD(P)+)
MIKQYNWTPKKEDETDESFLCSFLSKQPAEVFSPCATRYSITEKVINAFSNHRNQQNEYLQRAIISGANNVFSLPTLKDSLAQHNIFTIPEWVSNCGNALLFLESLKIEKLHPEWANGILLSISKRLKHLLKDALASCQNNKELLYDECTKTAIEKIQYENAVKIKKDYEKRIAC